MQEEFDRHVERCGEVEKVAVEVGQGLIKQVVPVPVEVTSRYPLGPWHHCMLQMDYSHLAVPVIELCEQGDLALLLSDSNLVDPLVDLPAIHAAADWTRDDILTRWYGWGDSIAFKNAAEILPKLKTVLEYAENDVSASKDIKPKLRYVTKVLKDTVAAAVRTDSCDPREILILMACHGGLCNVQKEIGIRCAFAALAGTLKSDLDEQNIVNVIRRLLKEQREQSIENLYRAQYLKGANSLNSHGLVGYRNEIAEKIGLEKIPDMHAGSKPVAHQYVDCFFERFYHVDTMIDKVIWALNSSVPRKLDYNNVVAFLRYNRPSLERFQKDPEEFLFHCFDPKTGEFTRSAVAYLLWKAGALKAVPGIIVQHLEQLLFPPLMEEEDMMVEEDGLRKSMDKALNQSCD